MTEEKLQTINYLTEKEYQQAKEEGTINENELYMTPDVEFIDDDTGWVNISISVGTIIEPFKIRKIGKIVNLSGVIKVSGTTELGEIPLEFVPSANQTLFIGTAHNFQLNFNGKFYSLSGTNGTCGLNAVWFVD